MRNHAFLYLLRPDGAAGELDLLAESNSTWPVLWRILFACTDAVAADDLERVFGHRVRHYLVADAQRALHRYERVVRYLLEQTEIAGMPEVRRYLAAARTHLHNVVQAYVVPDESAPLFLADLGEFSQTPELAQTAAERWWRQFEAAQRSGNAAALAALVAHAEPAMRVDRWRAWSDGFGLAFFTHPYFADSYRAPRADEYSDATPAAPMSDAVWPHRHGVAVVLRDERYGYIDAHGNVLVPPQFDEADDFSAAGIARVGKHRRYGLLRTDGSYAVPLEYDGVEWRAELDGWLCRRGNACTLLHADGSERIRSAWDAIEVLVPQRLLRVRHDRTVGAMHWSGAPALACEYSSLVARNVGAAVELLAGRGERMGVIDAEGRERVAFAFARIEELERHIEGCALTPIHCVRVYSPPERSRPKAGVWDVEAARLIVPCEYDFVWSVLLDRGRCGFIVANKTAYEGESRAERYRVGVLDATGAGLIPATYAWIGIKADLSKTGEFEHVREALHWAWSRGRPVEACKPNTDERVWIAPDGTVTGDPAAEVATLRAPDAKPTSMSALIAAAFYRFVELPDYKALRAPLLARCEALHVKGTILLASEGINGTIAGELGNVRAVLAYLRADPRLAQLEHKESPANGAPFYRMKVRLKREIVTLGVAEANAARMAGTYVKAEDWNALISDPDVVVIDARNDYEVALGTFQGALNPQTRSFRELPDWLRAQPLLKNKPKVAMFCTGGIRCEKSTAFLRSEGFEHVYHLQGGILKYLETIPQEQSRWQGECFVFDERVAIGHGLKVGVHELCRSCREPLGPTEKASAFYVEGVSCPKCYHQRSAAKKRGLLERQRQVELAKQRNDSHIGVRQELKREAKRRRRAS